MPSLPPRNQGQADGGVAPRRRVCRWNRRSKLPLPAEACRARGGPAGKSGHCGNPALANGRGLPEVAEGPVLGYWSPSSHRP